MKAILRKGAVACAAMLMGANVMAQSFDFTKEFQGDVEDLFYSNGGGMISASSFKDGKPRIAIAEEAEGNGDKYDEYGNYTFRYIINKVSILDVNLNVEKEFTSGPLFEEYVDVAVKSAAKALKVSSVDTTYSGSDVLNEFYRNFYVYIGSSSKRYSYFDLVENFTEDEVRGYVNDWFEGRPYNETIFLGERFLFESYNVEKSNYFEWGMKYPKEGWIYKDHNDICKVRINYVPDEYEEISRYNSRIYNACSYAEIGYFDFTVDMEVSGAAAIYSNTLFNDDDKYEFLLPELAVLESSSYNSYDGTLTTRYQHEPVGFKVVSEDGTVLHRLMINEDKENDVRCYAYLTRFGEKTYLIVTSYRVAADGEGTSGDVTCFYEIKKDGATGIQKVREMRGGMNIRPTVANRDEEITITLNDENSNVARELVVTGVNGQLVERRGIPAGENTVKVSAAMMRSGMYNFTLQKKGQVVDNGKVIVK